MTKKKLLNKIKNLKANQILWPAYIYLLYLLSIYVFSDSIYKHILNYVSAGVFILPIIITVWILLLFRKQYKEKTLLLSFLYCILPGFIFGLYISNGIYAMGHGDDIIAALPQFGIVGLIGGLITGALGLLINFFINLIKRT